MVDLGVVKTVFSDKRDSSVSSAVVNMESRKDWKELKGFYLDLHSYEQIVIDAELRTKTGSVKTKEIVKKMRFHLETSKAKFRARAKLFFILNHELHKLDSLLSTNDSNRRKEVKIPAAVQDTPIMLVRYPILQKEHLELLQFTILNKKEAEESDVSGIRDGEKNLPDDSGDSASSKKEATYPGYMSLNEENGKHQLDSRYIDDFSNFKGDHSKRNYIENIRMIVNYNTIKFQHLDVRLQVIFPWFTFLPQRIRDDYTLFMAAFKLRFGNYNSDNLILSS